jgi:hypothetical protein
MTIVIWPSKTFISFQPSALALLVTGVVADDAQHTAALHDLALLTDFLDAGTDLHDVPQIVSVI